MRSNHLAVRVALTVAVSMAASACGGTAERSAGGPGLSNITIPPPKAVTCLPRDSVTITGPGIGSIGVERKPPPVPRRHQLDVPSGAVPSGQSVKFRMTELQEPYVGVEASSDPTIQFASPVTLRLSYAGCSAPDTANLGIYIWRPAQNSWDRLPGSQLETNRHSVSVPLNTLQSEYALGAT